MNIRITQRYYDKVDKAFYEAGTERKVPDDRGHVLIAKGFAERIRTLKNKQEAVE